MWDGWCELKAAIWSAQVFNVDTIWELNFGKILIRIKEPNSKRIETFLEPFLVE